MGRPDGAHTHGSGGWDVRVVVAVALAGCCALPAGRSFLFAGLTEALLWIGGGIAACAALLVAVAWRIRRRDNRLRAALRDQAALYQASMLLNDRQKALMAARYGYPGHEPGILPQYLQQGTVTGRPGPERVHGVQETDRTVMAISDIDAVTGMSYTLYPDPGHE